jgi:cell division septation protein DedD
MKANSLLFLLFVLLLSACTSSEQTQTQKPKEQEIYVFDDAGVKSAKDTVKQAETKIKSQDVIPPVTEKKEMTLLKGMNFIVQLGAFSSKEKAEKFIAENKGKLNYEMNISFSESVKLYVVQIPPFSTKEEAEKVRNKLWETASFKDAFIVTVEKN